MLGLIPLRALDIGHHSKLSLYWKNIITFDRVILKTHNTTLFHEGKLFYNV